jgi:hypothetical protein
MFKFTPFTDAYAKLTSTIMVQTSSAGIIVFVTQSLPTSQVALKGFSVPRPVRPGKYNIFSSGYVTGSASGSFTSQIDPFRQGTSVSNSQLRATKTLPTIDGGTDDFAVVQLNYGQSSLFDRAAPFTDKPNLQSLNSSAGLLALVEGKTRISAFISPNPAVPVLISDIGYINKSPFDGVVEVISKRKKAFDNKIYSRSIDPLKTDNSIGIKADLADGNHHFEQGSDQINNYFEVDGAGKSPFVDNTSFMIFHSSSFIRGMPSFILDRTRQAGEGNVIATARKNQSYAYSPYNETVRLTSQYYKGDLDNMDPQLKAVIINDMTGSGDRFLPPGFKSATTGFIFTNQGQNVDSIAFGGLNRDA